MYFSLQISGLQLHDYLHQNQLQWSTSRTTARVNFAFSNTTEETIPITQERGEHTTALHRARRARTLGRLRTASGLAPAALTEQLQRPHHRGGPHPPPHRRRPTKGKGGGGKSTTPSQPYLAAGGILAGSGSGSAPLRAGSPWLPCETEGEPTAAGTEREMAERALAARGARLAPPPPPSTARPGPMPAYVARQWPLGPLGPGRGAPLQPERGPRLAGGCSGEAQLPSPRSRKAISALVSLSFIRLASPPPLRPGLWCLLSWRKSRWKAAKALADLLPRLWSPCP